MRIISRKLNLLSNAINLLLIVSFVIISFAFYGSKYNTVYAENYYNENIDTSKLTELQTIFFKLSYQKENNKNITKSDIDNLLSNLTLKETIQRKGDYIYIYSVKNEFLSVVASSNDKNSIIEGYAYRLNNPYDDIATIKMQYYNEGKEDRFINLQVSSDNQQAIYNLFKKVDSDMKNSELYSNYLNIFNSFNNVAVNRDDISTINPEFKFVNSPNEKNSSFDEYEIKGNLSEGIIARIDKKSGKLNELNLEKYIGKINEFNAIYSIRKNYQDDSFVRNYNFSDNRDFGYIIRMDRNCLKSIKYEFISILNNI